jgi:hypothetical protein
VSVGPPTSLAHKGGHADAKSPRFARGRRMEVSASGSTPAPLAMHDEKDGRRSAGRAPCSALVGCVRGGPFRSRARARRTRVSFAPSRPAMLGSAGGMALSANCRRCDQATRWLRIRRRSDT